MGELLLEFLKQYAFLFECYEDAQYWTSVGKHDIWHIYDTYANVSFCPKLLRVHNVGKSLPHRIPPC